MFRKRTLLTLETVSKTRIFMSHIIKGGRILFLTDSSKPWQKTNDIGVPKRGSVLLLFLLIV